MTNVQVPWASLGRAPVLVELDRLYLLAGPKEEFEEQDSGLEQVHTMGTLELMHRPSVTLCLRHSGL